MKPTAGSEAAQKHADTNNMFETKGQEKTVPWETLQLTALCVLELQKSSWTSAEELKSIAFFEDSLQEQLRKLNELGVDVKVEKSAPSSLPKELTAEEPAEEAEGGVELKTGP